MYTKNDALYLLKKAVDDRGETFVYPDEWRENDEGQCFYQIAHRPACIAGHVLYQVGLLDQVEEGNSFDQLDVAKKFFTPGAVQVIVAAQDTQDAGDTWGVAYEGAKIEATAFDEDGNYTDEPDDSLA